MQWGWSKFNWLSYSYKLFLRCCGLACQCMICYSPWQFTKPTCDHSTWVNNQDNQQSHTSFISLNNYSTVSQYFSTVAWLILHFLTCVHQRFWLSFWKLFFCHITGHRNQHLSWKSWSSQKSETAENSSGISADGERFTLPPLKNSAAPLIYWSTFTHSPPTKKSPIFSPVWDLIFTFVHSQSQAQLNLYFLV